MPYKDVYGNLLASIEDGIPPEVAEAAYPVLQMPKIPTMDKKLIIEAALPCWQPIKWYRDRSVQNLPLISIEDQAQGIVDCVKAGAALVHVHPRDPQSGMPIVHNPKVLAEILDRAFDRVGDFVTVNRTWIWDFKKSPYVDYISHVKQLLEKGRGNKYVQGTPMMTFGADHYSVPDHGGPPFIEGVKWLEEHDSKPFFDMRSLHIMRVKRWLFDSGVSKWKPHIVNILRGNYAEDNAFSDPWSQLQTIHDIYTLREAMPESCIGIYASGRNWLPVTVQGIMQGCDIVRTGTEDIFWLWPHRDDIMTTASQTTELIVTIAKALGREIATPAEAREILGMKLTSKL